MTNQLVTGHVVTAAEYDADVSRFAAWAHGKKTSDVSTSGTTFATGADLLASALTFTADGVSDYLLRIRAGYWTNSFNNAGQFLHANLDGTDVAEILATLATANAAYPCQYDITVPAPSAGSHTINARLRVDSGTGTVKGGTGGALTLPPLLVAVAVI